MTVCRWTVLWVVLALDVGRAVGEGIAEVVDGATLLTVAITVGVDAMVVGALPGFPGCDPPDSTAAAAMPPPIKTTPTLLATTAAALLIFMSRGRYAHNTRK